MTTTASWHRLAQHTLFYGWIGFLLSFLLFERTYLVNYFLWAGVLFPTLFVVRYADLKSYHRSLLINLWCVLILFLLASVFWSGEQTETFARYLKRAAYLYGFGLATFLVFDKRRDLDEQFFRWAPLIVAAAALLQIILFYSQHAFPERMTGPGRLSNPIHFGVVAAAVSIAALLQFGRLSRRMQVLTAAAILINCAAIYLCQSRGALLALVTTLVVSVLFIRRIFPALLVVLIGVAVLAFLLDPATLLERGVSFRTIIWQAQWERFWHCPALIGCGLGVDSGVVIDGQRFDNTHSLYLGWLLYGGFIGLAGYLVLLGGLIYEGVLLRSHAWTTLLLMGAASTVTSGDNILITPSPYWAVILIPMVAVLAKVAIAKAAQPVELGGAAEPAR